MQLAKITIFKIAVAFIIGIIISHCFDSNLRLLLYAFSAFFLILLLAWFRSKRQVFQDAFFGIVLYVFLMCLGALIYQLHQPLNQKNHYSNFIDSAKNHFFQIQIKEVLKPDLYHEKYIVEMIAVNEKVLSGNLLLMISKDSLSSEIYVDDVLLFKNSLQTIPKPKNPHQFDYSNYMKTQGVYHQVFITHKEILLKKPGKKSLVGKAYLLREHINQKLDNYPIEAQQRSIINALILGQRQGISSEIYQNYIQAGVVHILAVSGLHVGIILLLLKGLFFPIERLKSGKTVVMVLMVVLLWGFAVIAGLSPSVTRAVTMFSFLAIGMQLNRRTSTFAGLFSSAFVLLVINPNLLFHVGFQLSYMAVLGILTMYPILSKWYQPKWYVDKKLWQIFTVSIAAQCGVLPLSLYYFHQFPALFFVSNLVILPFLGLVLGLGILVIIIALLGVNFNIPAQVMDFLIELLNNFISWVAKQESFLFENIPFSALQMICLYLLLYALIVLWKNFSGRLLIQFLAAILFFQLSFLYHKREASYQELVIFNKSRNTIVGIKTNQSFQVFSTLDSARIIQERFLKDYVTNNRIKNIKVNMAVPNVFKFDEKHFLVVDSLSVYPKKSKQVDYIFLTGSPRINLNRLLDSVNPKQIIADNNNYKSYVNRWKVTCIERNIPFYYTAESGAFVLKK